METELYEIMEKIDQIVMDKSNDNIEIRRLLNIIEKDNMQSMFIKTTLCKCGKMGIEVWVKEKEFHL